MFNLCQGRLVLVEGLIRYRNTKDPEIQGVIHGKAEEMPADWNDPIEGRLVFIELPVGQYEFTKINLKGYPEKWFKDFTIPFEVVPGEVLYIGSIWMWTMYWGTDDAIQVRDESHKDLEFVASRWEEIDIDDVAIDIASIQR